MTTPEDGFTESAKAEELDVHVSDIEGGIPGLLRVLAANGSPMLDSLLDNIFSDEPETGKATNSTSGRFVTYSAPYSRTLMRIQLGLDPHEKLAEVSGGKQWIDPETGTVFVHRSEEYSNWLSGLVDKPPE